MEIHVKITARLSSAGVDCQAQLSTNSHEHDFPVSAKENGKGTQANGGELLSLALAGCFCNDIYREAATLGIDVLDVNVEVEAEFSGRGEAAKSINYRAVVTARADEAAITNLIKVTDSVAEVHNTLRQGMPVTLIEAKAIVVTD